MGPEDKKALALRYYDEFWCKGNADACDELLAENFVDHTGHDSTTTGRQSWKDLVRSWRTGFPDMHEDIELMLDAEDGCVVCRFIITGTHLGDYFGIAPTGRKIRITGTDILRMQDGVITDIWYNEDTFGLMRQLGADTIAELDMPGTEFAS